MGLGASKELPVAQQQLKRLTEELRIAQKAAEAASTSNKAASLAEATKSKDKVAALTSQLFASKGELEKISADLRMTKSKSMQAERKKNTLISENEKLKKSAEELEAERQNLAILQEASKMLNSEEHPTFGKLIADLGYKRVYCANAITVLAHTQVWKKQRAYRQKRAEKIASTKLSSGVNGWPGTISVVDNGIDPPMVIDGQHRLGACALMNSDGKLTLEMQTVLVEVHPYTDEKAISELFVEINKAEPVLNVDLPVDDIGATVDHNTILSGAADALQGKFPAMFKDSHKYMVPHLNVDVLRDKLHQADVIASRKFESEEALVTWLLAENTKMGEKGDAFWTEEKAGPARIKAVAKARKNGFWLGMDWSWLEEKG
mmetsp:Transcript_21562/g.51910  ORF Transcript_21562/g.51910 Transcript_21562/m.51910 type:complete len:376 (-) Transcript_21562:287-1414(-)